MGTEMLFVVVLASSAAIATAAAVDSEVDNLLKTLESDLQSLVPSGDVHQRGLEETYTICFRDDLELCKDTRLREIMAREELIRQNPTFSHALPVWSLPTRSHLSVAFLASRIIGIRD